MSNQVYDPNTGELITGGPVIEHRAIKPNLANARSLESVAGKQAKFINLKDNPDMNGKRVAIVRVVHGSGEFGDYAKILCFPLNESDEPGFPLVVMTGAENVLERVNTIAGDCSLENPILATFEKVGDAWLLN